MEPQNPQQTINIAPNQISPQQTENNPRNPPQLPNTHEGKKVLLIGGIIIGIFLLCATVYLFYAGLMKKQAISTKLSPTPMTSPTPMKTISPTPTAVTPSANTILNPKYAAKNPNFAFTYADKTRLETGLVSQDRDIVLSVLTESLNAVAKESPEFMATLLTPPNSTLQLDTNTIALDDLGVFGSMEATFITPGDQPEKLLIGIVREKGVWLITGADKLQDN